MPKKLILQNIICFQLGWFACVLGASYGYFWLGPLCVTLILLLHLKIHHSWKWEWPLLTAGMISGLIFDSLLILLDIQEPKRALMPAPLTTVWLLAMWINFTLTLNISLRFLQKKLFLAAVCGFIAGPSAYYSGEILGAIQIKEPLYLHLLVLAVVWMLATPGLLLIARISRQKLFQTKG